MCETCYRCGNEPYLSKNYEVIDGKQQLICGKCKNITCSICGKSKYDEENNIQFTHWSSTVNHETGEILYFGNCCINIEGKQDPVKQGIRKYNDLQHKDPDTFNKLNEQIAKQQAGRQQVLNQKPVADKLIDSWAANQKRNKIISK